LGRNHEIELHRPGALEGQRAPAQSLTAEQATAHFGNLAVFVAGNGPATSEKTRAVLGWEPREMATDRTIMNDRLCFDQSDMPLEAGQYCEASAPWFVFLRHPFN
jgi:hypothetical protein